MQLKKFCLLCLFLFFSLVIVSCAKKPSGDQIKKSIQSTEWKEAKPEDQGMDAKLLAGSDQFIRERYPNVYSLIVIRHGVLVYEKYYQDKDKESYTHVFSVTKSVISALVGIAIEEKYLNSLDQKIFEFFPEYFTANMGPKKREITLRHVLTMTAGLEPADDNIFEWMQSDDWFKYEIDRKLLGNPGQKFNYDTGLAHLLSGVLSKATKMSTLQFAEKYLFRALGIVNKRWDTDTRGFNGGGHLLHLTPRDMAKFGQLYLNHGIWGTNQIIQESWVTDSVKNQVVFDSDSGYGYLWWLSRQLDKSGKHKVAMFSAVGYGGQRIDVIPELDLVAVITANAEMLNKENGNTSEIINKYVLPAVK